MTRTPVSNGREWYNTFPLSITKMTCLRSKVGGILTISYGESILNLKTWAQSSKKEWSFLFRINADSHSDETLSDDTCSGTGEPPSTREKDQDLKSETPSFDMHNACYDSMISSHLWPLYCMPAVNFYGYFLCPLISYASLKTIF